MKTDSNHQNGKLTGIEMLEYYEKGPWPSHVNEMKKTAYPLEVYASGLETRASPWFGGSAKVRYVYVGFIARRSKDGKNTELHFRVFQPSGQIYRTETLRKLLDFSDKYGLGLLQVMGQTGGLIISIDPEKADEAVDALRSLGTDIGDTGDTFRDFASCIGPALCEYSLFNTLEARDYYLSYPPIYEKISNQLFPFKVKLKFSGCPMDCSRAVHRADFGFIGTWEGAPEVDQALLKDKDKSGQISMEDLARNCPSSSINVSVSGDLSIDPEKCEKSMNCIKRAFPAIKPGKTRKIAFMAGGNIKGRFGPKMAKPVALLDDYKQAEVFITSVIDRWEENYPHKDRIGDMLAKEGFSRVVEALKETLPVAPNGKPSGQTRIIDSAVLSDEERDLYATWSRKIMDEYRGA